MNESRRKSSSRTKSALGAPTKALSRSREVLEQMYLCRQLLRDGERDPIVLGSVRRWYESLARELPSSGALDEPIDLPLGDIVDEPNAERRASSFFPIVSAAVNDLDASPQTNTKRFLTHVAWHEGARLTARVQGGGGPARGFFQFEAYRAKEAISWAKAKGFMSKLATVASTTEAKITAAAKLLPDFDPNDPKSSVFPKGNLIEKLLVSSDPFCTYLCRIEFSRFSAPIGSSNSDHADYWYKYWKRTGGNESQLKARFTREANEIDAFLVSQIKRFGFLINGKPNSLERYQATWLQKNGSTVTNTYFDRPHDATWVYMDDGAKGVVEIRVPVAGGDAQERLYRRGSWKSYATALVVEYV